MWELKIEHPDGRVDKHFCEDRAAMIALCDHLHEQETETPLAGTKFTVSNAPGQKVLYILHP